ncbi:hypothetical protein, partial [uncultured Chryseobacterium sp.]|uniref:hypothetical protein n=1 Tax=uncultured Chryseobacterium sp. TaxID=259322 RepID=UPI002600D31A
RKMYREPVINKQKSAAFQKNSRYAPLRFASEQTTTENLSLANIAAPSVRVFFAARRRKMYREPVINKQKSAAFQKNSRYAPLRFASEQPTTETYP